MVAKVATFAIAAVLGVLALIAKEEISAAVSK
jgi:hypothetical protein